MKVPLTVTIIAKDEAERLPACLASVAWAAEVLVLDSGSADCTAELARAAGAVVHVESWRGYGAMKNRAAALAAHDHILNLDADERVDDRLAAAIQRCDWRLPAYRLRRRNHVGGIPIRHWPWAWDRQVRLYDRRQAAFAEAIVHESLVFAGRAGELEGVLDHLTYRDWEDCARRHRRYASLWAEDARRRGRRSGVFDGLRPLLSLAQQLILRGHVVGGLPSWRWAVEHAAYVRAKYRELARPER